MSGKKKKEIFFCKAIEYTLFCRILCYYKQTNNNNLKKKTLSRCNDKDTWGLYGHGELYRHAIRTRCCLYTHHSVYSHAFLPSHCFNYGKFNHSLHRAILHRNELLLPPSLSFLSEPYAPC